MRRKYKGSVCMATLECMTTSGIIYGWASLHYVLTRDGYFREQCPPKLNLTKGAPDEWCQIQDEGLADVISAAGTAFSISACFTGLFLDVFGTLAARTCASIMYFSGSMMLAVSTPQTSYLLYPAMSFYAVGGHWIMMTNIQLGNLNVSKKNSITNLINGAFDSSSVMFLFIKFGYDSGKDLAFSTSFFTALVVVQIVHTLAFMPIDNVPYPIEKNYDYGLIRDCDCRFNWERSRPEILTDEDFVELRRRMTFYDCILDKTFWFNSLHFSVLSLRDFFYLSTLNSNLNTLTPDIGHHLNVFGLFQSLGILVGPVLGIYIDWMARVFRISSSETCRFRAIAYGAALTTYVAVVFSCFALFPYIEIQYVTLFLEVVFRSFISGGNISFLTTFYPSKHFGKLYGVTMTVSGLFGFISSPINFFLFQTMSGEFIFINFMFILLCALTYVHPHRLLSKYSRGTKVKKSFMKRWFPQTPSTLSNETAADNVDKGNATEGGEELSTASAVGSGASTGTNQSLKMLRRSSVGKVLQYEKVLSKKHERKIKKKFRKMSERPQTLKMLQDQQVLDEVLDFKEVKRKKDERKIENQLRRRSEARNDAFLQRTLMGNISTAERSWFDDDAEKSYNSRVTEEDNEPQLTFPELRTSPSVSLEVDFNKAESANTKKVRNRKLNTVKTRSNKAEAADTTETRSRKLSVFSVGQIFGGSHSRRTSYNANGRIKKPHGGSKRRQSDKERRFSKNNGKNEPPKVLQKYTTDNIVDNKEVKRDKAKKKQKQVVRHQTTESDDSDS